MPKTAVKGVKPSSRSKKSSDAELAAENAALKARIAELEADKKQKFRANEFWRSALAGIFATIAVICFTIFSVSFWAKNSILDTDQFVAATAPIIENQDVQKTLKDEISTAVFENLNVEQELKKALPENLQFLATPLAGQVENFADDKIAEVLASEQLETAWTEVLRTSQSTLVGYIQNPNNDGKITINELYAIAGKELQSSSVGFLFGKTLPANVGDFTVREVTWLPKARQYIDAISRLTNVLLVVTVLSTIAAFALTRKRRAMLVTMTIFVAILMVSIVVALQVIAAQTGQAVDSQYSATARAVFEILTNTLKQQSLGVLALCGAILLIAFVTSNIKEVVKVRQFAARSLDRAVGAGTSRLEFESPHWLQWLASNKVVLCWTLTIVLFVIFTFGFPPEASGVKAALIWSAIVATIFAVIASISRTAPSKT